MRWQAWQIDHPKRLKDQLSCAAPFICAFLREHSLGKAPPDIARVDLRHPTDESGRTNVEPGLGKGRKQLDGRTNIACERPAQCRHGVCRLADGTGLSFA